MGLDVPLADLRDTTTFFSGDFDVSSVFMTVCCALSIYNGFELLLLILTTFRRFHGLYFWSLLVSSFGLLPYTVGLMIMYFPHITSSVAGLVITCVGWPMLVTGQSLVLYSRLHVVLGSAYHRLLKGVKWMIIVNGVAFHVSTEVSLFGAYYASQSSGFAEAYKYIEKIQMTGFTVQELILSGIYVWKTLDIIRATSHNSMADETHKRKKHTSRIMWQLFSINVLIVFMDVALLVIEYQDRHVFQQGLKGVVYSVKLKMEFAILSKLVALTTRNGSSIEGTFTGAFEDYNATISPGADPGSIERDRPTLLPTSSKCWPPARDQPLDFEKGDVAYVERVSGSADGTASNEEPMARQTTSSTITRSVTNDEQRRRRTMEEDLYASAMRGLSG